MNQRGRKSAVALAVVQTGKIDAIQRPEPPSHLTIDQAQEWIRVVNDMPADWFGQETHELLAQYCRHVVTARRVSVMIEDLIQCGGNDWLDDYDRLLKMQEREGRAMTALARSMRITQQSQYHPEKRRKGSAGVKRPY